MGIIATIIACAPPVSSQYISLKEKPKHHRRPRLHNKSSNLRCVVTCGGANGVRHPEAEWSTWSYKVLDSGPGDEEAFERRARECRRPKNRLLRAIVFDLESRDSKPGKSSDISGKRQYSLRAPIACWYAGQSWRIGRKTIVSSPIPGES